jgi:hypothetical protein
LPILTPADLILLLVGVVIIPVWGVFWIRRINRGPNNGARTDSIPEVLSSPPDNLSPALVGMILWTIGGGQKIIATLIDLADRGYIRIEHRGKYSIGSTTIIKLKDDNANSFEQFVIDKYSSPEGKKFIPGGGPDHRKITTHYFSKSVNNYATDNGFFKEHPSKKGALFLYLVLTLSWGIPCVGILIWGLPLQHTDWARLGWLPSVTLSLVGFIGGNLDLRRGSFLKLTDYGLKEATMWKAFYKYLKTVLSQKTQPDENPDVWLHYLPYAVDLRKSKQWAIKFSKMNASIPHWYAVVSPPANSLRRGKRQSFHSDVDFFTYDIKYMCMAMDDVNDRH